MMDDCIRVVVDTNLWISLLIGGKLGNLLEVLVDPKLELVSTELLKAEIVNVTQRPKFQRYFSKEKVEALMEWMDEVTTTVTIDKITPRCRDPKDDYLLELAVQSHAIYLVSGDNDLLVLQQVEGCRIMTCSQFIDEMKHSL